MKLPKIYFEYATTNGMTKYLRNLNKRRIACLIASESFKKSFLRGRLRVSYGKAICNKGCLCEFENEIIGGIKDIKYGLDSFLDNYLYL